MQVDAHVPPLAHGARVRSRTGRGRYRGRHQRRDLPCAGLGELVRSIDLANAHLGDVARRANRLLDRRGVGVRYQSGREVVIEGLALQRLERRLERGDAPQLLEGLHDEVGSDSTQRRLRRQTHAHERAARVRRRGRCRGLRPNICRIGGRRRAEVSQPRNEIVSYDLAVSAGDRRLG